MAIVDPSIPLQVALVAALKRCGSAAGARVYDDVPPEAKRKAATGAAWPYISLGNFQVISEKTECLQGAEVYVTIDAWSNAAGKAEIKGIGRDIIAELDDADLSTPTLAVNSCLLDDVEYTDESDGLTSHAVLTFHILTD